MSDDAPLVRQAQAGDAAGLGELLERHRALLHAVAVGMLGHGPQAEDAVHDTFVIALRRIGDLRDPAAARAWLLAILGNVCRAQLRRATPEPMADVPEPPAGAPVEAAIDRLALRDWVWTALDRLSPPLRLAVVLRYFSGASSYDAIADLSGVPVGTIRSRLNAARTQLADALLETAADRHPGPARELAVATGVAMTALQRTGDASALHDVFREDLRFRLADRVQRQGRDAYAARIVRDLEDGVSARVRNVVVGADLALIELWLDSPPGQPLHCPPAATQVHFHDGHVTDRVVAHYAPRPGRLEPMTNERGTAPAR
jgi:RNA polymerase sigma-70 factor, ECF subfamily